MGTRLAGVVLLDTHVWVWRVNAPQRLSRPAARAIESADRTCVASMTVLELADLFERRRIRIRIPPRAWMRDALRLVEALPLTAEVALDAAQLRFTSDPFDRVIYATARSEDAILITRDQVLRDFDPRLTVW